MKILLIGGGNDGRRIEMEEPIRPLLQTVVKQNVLISFSRMEMIDTPMHILYYHLKHLRGEKETFPVYVHDKLTPDEMIKKLIEGYHDPKH